MLCYDVCTEDPLKEALRAETHAWRMCYARHCNAKYRDLMNETFRFIDDVSKRLGRPINDLGDVRLVVDTLCELRLREIDVDMSITPIEVRTLNRHSSSDMLFQLRLDVV